MEKSRIWDKPTLHPEGAEGFTDLSFIFRRMKINGGRGAGIWCLSGCRHLFLNDMSVSASRSTVRGFMHPPLPKDRWSKVEQFDL
jgi:hypothetical protein